MWKCPFKWAPITVFKATMQRIAAMLPANWNPTRAAWAPFATSCCGVLVWAAVDQLVIMEGLAVKQYPHRLLCEMWYTILLDSCYISLLFFWGILLGLVESNSCSSEHSGGIAWSLFPYVPFLLHSMEVASLFPCLISFFSTAWRWPSFYISSWISSKLEGWKYIAWNHSCCKRS